jgi:RNA polymerase sigma factor (sigma-70 family)
MQTDDGRIIQDCLGGKPQAFGILVDKYKEGVYAYIYAELRDFHDAQDVTQEVFLQAYRDLRSLRRWESFSFWLYRIAYRRCIQWFRVNSRRVDRESIEDQEQEVIDAPSLGSYRGEKLCESVREALDSLPEIYREVLLLHYFGGMTSKAIAEALGISPTAVLKRLSRARSQLRKEMVAMMDTAFEGQRLPAGFTFRIVEAVKRIKIHPMPRVAGLPWGLSLAAGIIIAALSLNPHLSIQGDMAIPTGSPLPIETKVLKAGEIPVDILKTSEISVISSKQANDDGGEPQLDPQNAFVLAPHREDGKWTKKADMPKRRGTHAACVVNGKIYVVGGGTGLLVLVPEVEEYDPVKDTWTQKARIPTPRGFFSASAAGGRIYAIGGVDTINGVLKATEEYDPAADKWTEKADMPTARWSLSTSALNGKVYAIGGWAGSKEAGWALSIVEEYDPVADTWTRKADMPTARSGLSTSVIYGKIYAIGGYEENGAMSFVEEYDPVTNTWTTKDDIPTARSYFSASSVEEKIYAIGGNTSGADHIYTSVVEEYAIGVAVQPKRELTTTWGNTKRAR